MRSFFTSRQKQVVALSLVVLVLAHGTGAVAETIFVTDPSETKMSLDQPVPEASATHPSVRAPTQPLAGPMGVRSQQKSEADLPQTGFTRYTRKSIRVNGDRETRGMAALQLSAQNPDFSIIECIANCLGPVGTVVYFKPRVPTVNQPLADSGVVRIADVSITPQLRAIVCVAGCYDKLPQPPSDLRPVAGSSRETAVVVSSAEVTPAPSVPSTRSIVSIGGLRQLKSRVRQTRARHQWRIERASVFTSYAKSYHPGYRAY